MVKRENLQYVIPNKIVQYKTDFFRKRNAYYSYSLECNKAHRCNKNDRFHTRVHIILHQFLYIKINIIMIKI